jgi:hypothetical protein
MKWDILWCNKAVVCMITCGDPSSEKLRVKATLQRIIKFNQPVTVAGIVGSNPNSRHGCLVFVWFFLCLFTGRGLATSWSPAQGVLPTVQDLENRSETESFMEVGQGPNWSCSAKKKTKFNSGIKGDWCENELGRGLHRGFHITTREALKGINSRQSCPSNFRLRCSPLVRHTNEAITKMYEICKEQHRNGVPVRFMEYLRVENSAVIVAYYRPSFRHGLLGARVCEQNSWNLFSGWQICNVTYMLQLLFLFSVWKTLHLSTDFVYVKFTGI